MRTKIRRLGTRCHVGQSTGTRARQLGLFPQDDAAGLSLTCVVRRRLYPCSDTMDDAGRPYPESSDPAAKECVVPCPLAPAKACHPRPHARSSSSV